MTPEEQAKADAEAAKAKKEKADTFMDKLADKVIEKQEKKAAAGKPPSRDSKPDPILDGSDTISGDQDLDEFMFGEKPAAAAKPDGAK